MALNTGTRLGAYEITSLIGAGGMGEVYRARDTKLNRQVALKVLPASFDNDSDRLARFKREAQVLASLNHSNIAHIHGLEESSGVSAIVMELVDGDDLSALIGRGPLALADAIGIAKQIADALEAAHELGIIHRDLKPANIKVRTDGTVKVLDFGLAKALDPAGDSSAEPMNSPTVTSHRTETGVVLGTASFMSPEQAQGRAVDRRTDIWAFGAVLYEMLSGRRAFGGGSSADAIAAVLRQDIDWTLLPAGTPAAVRRLIARCLDRDVKRRLRDIGEARIVLDDAASRPIAQRDDRAGSDDRTRRQPWRRAVPLAISAAAAAALTGTAWYASLEPAAPPAVIRFTVTLPEGQVFTGLSGRAVALSPDGTMIAYVSNGRLNLRSMSDLESKPILGTEGFQAVADPVFSPDGRWLAFHAIYDQTLKKIAVTGGAAITITKAELPFGMNWGPDGIVYGQGAKSILRVSPDGGAPETLVSLTNDEVGHGPQVLPGGGHVLFTLATGDSPDRWNTARVVVQSLTSGERKIVVEGGSDARYVPTGHLIYALGGSVLAVAFDVQRLQVTSGPVPIIDGVRRATLAGAANFSFSESGSLAYVPGPASGSGAGKLDLALADRNGRLEPLKLPGGAYVAPRASPDGTRIAFSIDDAKETAVWIYNLSGTSAMRRVTFGGNNRFPIWSSDSTRIAFQSDRDGDRAVFWQSVGGTGTAERLTKPDAGTSHEPESWSPDGETLLFSVTKGTDVTLWMFSMRNRTATTFGSVHSLTRTNAVFSPDGRWVAYASTEQGQTRTFIQPFPPTGARHQIAAGLASQPVWTPDGKELFFNPRPGTLAVVTFTTKPTIGFSNPVALMRPLQTGPPQVRRAFDMTPSGKFVGLITAGQTESTTREMDSQIRVVLNWFKELEQRVKQQ